MELTTPELAILHTLTFDALMRAALDQDVDRCETLGTLSSKLAVALFEADTLAQDARRET